MRLRDGTITGHSCREEFVLAFVGVWSDVNPDGARCCHEPVVVRATALVAGAFRRDQRMRDRVVLYMGIAWDVSRYIDEKRAAKTADDACGSSVPFKRQLHMNPGAPCPGLCAGAGLDTGPETTRCALHGLRGPTLD